MRALAGLESLRNKLKSRINQTKRIKRIKFNRSERESKNVTHHEHGIH